MSLTHPPKVVAPPDETAHGDSRADHAEPIDSFPDTSQVRQRFQSLGREMEEAIEGAAAAADSKILDEEDRFAILAEAIAQNRRAIIRLAYKFREFMESSSMALANSAVEGVADSRSRIEQLKAQPAAIPEHLKSGKSEDSSEDGSEEESDRGQSAEEKDGEEEVAQLAGNEQTHVNGEPDSGKGRIKRAVRAVGEAVGGAVAQAAQSMNRVPEGGR